MMIMIAVNTFFQLILLILFHIIKTKCHYKAKQNKNSEAILYIEGKFGRILISNKRLGLIGLFIKWFCRLSKFIFSGLFDLNFFYLFFNNHWWGWRRNFFSNPSRESTFYVAKSSSFFVVITTF